MRSVTCLLLVLVLVGTVCVTSFVTRGIDNNSDQNGVNGTPSGPINPQEGSSWWDFHLQYCFAAYNAIHAALFFQGAVTLYDQAVAKGLDVSVINDLLARADALLAEAQAFFEEGDCRNAGRKALDAVYLYLQAISGLEGLLGVRLPY